MTAKARAYFSTLTPVLRIYVSVLMPVPSWWLSFVVSVEIGKNASSKFILLFKACFVCSEYRVLLWLPLCILGPICRSLQHVTFSLIIPWTVSHFLVYNCAQSRLRCSLCQMTTDFKEFMWGKPTMYISFVIFSLVTCYIGLNSTRCVSLISFCLFNGATRSFKLAPWLSHLCWAEKKHFKQSGLFGCWCEDSVIASGQTSLTQLSVAGHWGCFQFSLLYTVSWWVVTLQLGPPAPQRWCQDGVHKEDVGRCLLDF